MTRLHNLQLYQTHTITITHLGVYGEGVGKIEGMTFFVSGALPSETVVVEITELRRNFGRAKLIHIEKTAPFRQLPPCPIFGKCGGCQIMHMAYDQQLLYKQQKVIDALERVGHVVDPHVEACIASPQPYFYRNKIQLPTQMGPSGLQFGLYAQDSHHVVPLEKCWIHSMVGEEVFNRVLATLRHHHVDADLLRHLLIKSSLSERKALLVFVTKTKDPGILQQVAKELVSTSPQIAGVFHNWNPEITNRILSSRFTLMAGRQSILETVCGLTFKISPASFFQVNVMQAEHLYLRALQALEIKKGEVILDAYCGVGTLSLILAREATRVIGIECVTSAIIDAQENARHNGLNHVEFLAADVGAAIHSIGHFDLAVLNPPRKGCDPVVLDAIKTKKLRRLVYISCDPATLARDLLYLSDTYRLKYVIPFDMFPQTSHVESLAVLDLFGN